MKRIKGKTEELALSEYYEEYQCSELCQCGGDFVRTVPGRHSSGEFKQAAGAKDESAGRNEIKDGPLYLIRELHCNEGISNRSAVASAM